MRSSSNKMRDSGDKMRSSKWTWETQRWCCGMSGSWHSNSFAGCHKTIPLQAIAWIPDSTSHGSWVTLPSHALPSLPNTSINPRTFPQIPCTIPKILCHPTYLSAQLPLSRRANLRLCIQQLHNLRAFDTQLLYHQTHLLLSAYPCYLAQSSDINGTGQDRNSGAQ